MFGRRGRLHPMFGRAKDKNPFYGRKHSNLTRANLSELASLRIGERASKWKGGIKWDGPYRMLYMPKHPGALNKYVYEHRLVMEKILGRRLRNHEIVHHINGDEGDNREDNLKLFTNHSGHAKFHAMLRRLRRISN